MLDYDFLELSLWSSDPFEHFDYALALVDVLATPPCRCPMSWAIMLSCPLSIPRHVDDRRQTSPEHIVMD